VTVGFVGLGNIGLPISLRLVANGHDVRVFDVSTKAVDRAVAGGATAADGLRAVADACETVFTCLPSPAVVTEVVAGRDGLLRAGSPGRLIVDLSTNDPAVVAQLADDAAASSSSFLDAPVAGGVPGAEAGTLTVMVGGDRDAFDRVLPLLRCFGQNVFHLGAAGTGSVAKLANNLLAFCNMAAAAEAFLAAKHAGIDPRRFLEVLTVASGNSASLERYRRKVLSGDFGAEFALDLGYKDLALAMKIGEAAGVPMLFASTLRETLEQARASGYGSDDVCSVVRVLEDRTGETIRSAS
jgi:3-hydroxyisobutyrate dehydrogenase-like beta-hydroxyacid dehydrogenase